MLLTSYFRFGLLALLATFVPTVDGKGGGRKGGGGVKNTGKGKHRINHTWVGAGASRREECRDAETNQVVPCPKKGLSRAATIAIAVIFSVLGAVLLGLAIFYFVRRRKQQNKRMKGDRSIDVPDMPTSTKQEYKPLTDTPYLPKHNESAL